MVLKELRGDFLRKDSSVVFNRISYVRSFNKESSAVDEHLKTWIITR